jgi:hypothetical protein
MKPSANSQSRRSARAMLRVLHVLALLCLLAGSRRVAAQSKEPADYRETVAEAVREFEAGHFEESRALFTRAHAHYPNARTLRGLGMVEYELRNYPEAIRNLEEALATKTRRLEGELRAQTEALLARAHAYVSRVGLVLQPNDARVLVDGALANLGGDRSLLLTVGEHVIDVQAEGYRSERRMLSLKSGGDETLQVALQRLTASEQPVEPAAGASAGAQSDRAAPTQEAPALTKVGAWVLTGTSAAVLVAGIALVAIGFNDISRVENASSGSRWSSVEQAHDRAPVLTGTGFALSATGAVGLVAGLVWALKKPRADVPNPSAARALALASGHF